MLRFIEEATGQVIGLILSNVERHLLPAHIERIEHPDKGVGRTQLLPSDRASHSLAPLACVRYLGGGPSLYDCS